MPLCMVMKPNELNKPQGSYIYRYDEGYMEVEMKEQKDGSLTPVNTYGILYPLSYFDGKVIDLNRQFSPSTKGEDWDVDLTGAHFTENPLATHAGHGRVVVSKEQDDVEAILQQLEWEDKRK